MYKYVVCELFQELHYMLREYNANNNNNVVVFKLNIISFFSLSMVHTSIYTKQKKAQITIKK